MKEEQEPSKKLNLPGQSKQLSNQFSLSSRYFGTNLWLRIHLHASVRDFLASQIAQKLNTLGVMDLLQSQSFK